MSNVSQMKENIRQLDDLLADLESIPAARLRRRGRLIRSIDALLDANRILAEAELEGQRPVAAGPGEARQPAARSGHAIAAEQIAKHGADRYPTLDAQMLHLVSEIGELAEEVLRHRAKNGLSAEFRREYADVGLSLYELGNKLGLDLIACMAELVSNDERDFR
jgi:NTP pyrophosphatase (non-canonical NTP hydrolase)